MLNSNTLYNAVFQPKYEKFNPATDFFTVIVDTPSFAPFYQEVRSRLNSLMNQDSFRYFHAQSEAELSRNAIEEKMSEVIEVLDSHIENEPPKRRFCVLTYFDEENREIDSLLWLLGHLEHESRDVVTLMVSISKRMSGQPQFLHRLFAAVSEKAPYVELYLFTDGHTPYYRRSLVQSICGAIVVYADLEKYRTKCGKQSVVRSNVEQYISSSLSDQGREHILSLPAVEWSTVHFKNYDRRYDFINQYLLHLCNHLKRIDSDSFESLQNEIYQTVVPSRDGREVRTALDKAISAIPYVVKAVPKNSVHTLQEYFELVYGEKGISTVDLTLKATLSGIYRFNTEERVKKCCRLLFEKCSGFAEEDLYAQVCSLLEHQVQKLHSSYQGMGKKIKLILEEEFDAGQYTEGVEDSMGQYLAQYILLYEKQKTEAFWVEALRQIKTYPEEYTEYCRKACEYHGQLQQLMGEIPTSSVYRFDELPLLSLTTEEILSLDQNEALCVQINRVFAQYKDEVQRILAPENCAPVFSISSDSHFYQSYSVELQTESYTLCGCEYIGKYLVLIGGDEDV